MNQGEVLATFGKICRKELVEWGGNNNSAVKTPGLLLTWSITLPTSQLGLLPLKVLILGLINKINSLLSFLS